MKLRHVAAAAALLCGAAASHAVTIFTDNFDSATLGLNTTPAGWTVTGGTVDTIGVPGMFDLLPGNGRYVDLDGSSNFAGIFSHTFSLTAGTTYVATYSLAGSQRGDSNLVEVTFGTSAASYTLASSAGFSLQSLTFTPTTTGTYSLSFANGGFQTRASDNMGALLDNVTIATSVPEPSSYALMLAGLAGVGVVVRRRSRKA